jgi:hypothetical protein
MPRSVSTAIEPPASAERARPFTFAVSNRASQSFQIRLQSSR